jgi:hypothetical protein
MQQYNHPQLNLQIKFILLTESVGFIPNTILNSCYLINIKRPEKDEYINFNKDSQSFKQIVNIDQNIIQKFKSNISNPKQKTNAIQIQNISNYVNDKLEISGLLNAKEVRSFSICNSKIDAPRDNFNIICNAIIDSINNPTELVITELRDVLYDILIYNLDAMECIWYTLYHFISSNKIKSHDLSEILEKTFTFSKQYNNNYRPIYHLESMFFYIINKIYSYKCQ